MRILQIKSSVFNGNGQSSRLADEFVARLREEQPDLELIQRDLVADPVPHLDGARAGAFFTKRQERTPEQRAVIAYSDRRQRRDLPCGQCADRSIRVDSHLNYIRPLRPGRSRD